MPTPTPVTSSGVERVLSYIKMKKFKILYVYILKCSDGTYYTGVTYDMELRLEQHNSGINKDAYTYNKRPLILAYCEMFNNYNLAIHWEKRIKNWSKKKKEALINSDWDKLKEFSKCKNGSVSIPKMKLPRLLDSARSDSTVIDSRSR